MLLIDIEDNSKGPESISHEDNLSVGHFPILHFSFGPDFNPGLVCMKMDVYVCL